MPAYRTANQHYREKFGCKIYKLSIDGGFTCPNRDGTLGTGGCIFCSAYGGGDFAGRGVSIEEQLENARGRVIAKNKGGKFIAYFQAFTGTYAPVAVLREKYMAAIAPEDVVGLAVATRPDCLDDGVIELLAQVNRIKPVSVELGLQTSRDDTARYIRRGYATSVYDDAVKRLKAAGMEVVTHIIIGLPGEQESDPVQTTRHALAAGTDGIKFHLLHVLRGTDLEAEFACGSFRCLTLPEYARILKACIDVLPPHITVHRITGDGAKKDLIAPMWSADKKHVLNYLNRYINNTADG